MAVTYHTACGDCLRPVLPKGADGRCVCGDRIHTDPGGSRPARTTRLVRLESVVIETSEGRTLVTARRCIGCGIHLLSEGGNMCALCLDEQTRLHGVAQRSERATIHDGTGCGACGKPNPGPPTGFFWCDDCRAADCMPDGDEQ